VAGLDEASLPLVRLPGGAEFQGPSPGQVSPRALGIGRELAPREEVDLLVVGAGPAGLGAADGQLEAVTLKTGERLRFSFLFLFLGAEPCTEWLDDTIARDDHGFILTGAAAGAAHLLGTTVPGVFAAGDVRSGSTKRCATAVGEGAWAVQLVHAHLVART
jgi:thioredoxin reductase